MLVPPLGIVATYIDIEVPTNPPWKVSDMWVASVIGVGKVKWMAQGNLASQGVSFSSLSMAFLDDVLPGDDNLEVSDQKMSPLSGDH